LFPLIADDVLAICFIFDLDMPYVDTFAGTVPACFVAKLCWKV
jgi:hypothetical protein